jgi:hypothetical protein
MYLIAMAEATSFSLNLLTKQDFQALLVNQKYYTELTLCLKN